MRLQVLKENLHELLAYPDCENRDKNGRKNFDWIAMNATALRIWRTLPDFVRNTKVIPAM